MLKIRPGGIEVFCDCCGKEKLGELREGSLLLKAKRHGQEHAVKISVDTLAYFVGILRLSEKTQGAAAR